MPSMDSLFGVHAQALMLRSQRSSVLAANIANADTPNFKAKDIDFKTALSEAGGDLKPIATATGHVDPAGNVIASTLDAIRYRIPNQASLDGNTVESDVEQGRFADNAIHYQASLNFINGKVNGLIRALKGE